MFNITNFSSMQILPFTCHLVYNGGKYNAKTLDFSIYFAFAKYIVVGGTQSFLAKWKVHSVGLQSR
jgi:hypothetical protein